MKIKNVETQYPPAAYDEEQASAPPVLPTCDDCGATLFEDKEEKGRWSCLFCTAQYYAEQFVEAMAVPPSASEQEAQQYIFKSLTVLRELIRRVREEK